MQLISKFNKRLRLLLCVIDIFHKYTWVVSLKDKKGISIVNSFQKILNKLGRKSNKIWVDRASEFYNNSFIKWLKNYDIQMHSIHNEGKSVVAERFIRTLKIKIYKYMTAISKNVYINKLYDIVNEYNDTYHRTIKMKPVDVKDNTYIDFEKEVYNEDPKFKIGDHVRISKQKNNFAKGYTPNWSEEVFVIKKLKNTVPWTYVINALNAEELEHFMKNNCKRLIKKNLELKKYLGKKVINYMLNGKVMIIHLIAGLIKNIFYNIIARFHLIK